MAQQNASVLATYEQLLTRATSKFNKLIDSPVAPSGSQQAQQFTRTFAVYDELWKYQQQHRVALVEAGLKRSEIGEIASKIGQLYYNWYLRCADTRALSEAYVFYEAIHARQYFSADPAHPADPTDPNSHGHHLAIKQLRYYARFIIVCLMLGRKEEACALLQEFQALISAFSMACTQHEAQDWGMVIHEVCTFLAADVAMPMPRSPGTAISFKPHLRCSPTGPEASAAPYQRRLRAAVLASYQHRQVKIAELPVDVFRFMQTLEWQLGVDDTNGHARPLPSTQSDGGSGEAGAGGARLGTRVIANSSVADMGMLSSSLAAHGSGVAGSSPSINPPKTMLHRTTVPTLLSTLHVVAAGTGSSGSAAGTPTEVERDGVLLLYVAASSLRGRLAAASGQAHPDPAHYPTEYGRILCLSPPRANAPASCTLRSTPTSGNVYAQSSSTGGAHHVPDAPDMEVGLLPEDLIPLTRKRLLLVVDSDAAHEYTRVVDASLTPGSAALLSPAHRPSAFGDSTVTGSFFTLALTSPLMSWCLVCGEHDPLPTVLGAVQEAVDESLGEVASTLHHALQQQPQSVWATIFQDPMLRQHLARFVLVRALCATHRASAARPDCQPMASPALPAEVDPLSHTCTTAVLRIASVLKRQTLFEDALPAAVAAAAREVSAGAAAAVTLGGRTGGFSRPMAVPGTQLNDEQEQEHATHGGDALAAELGSKLGVADDCS